MFYQADGGSMSNIQASFFYWLNLRVDLSLCFEKKSEEITTTACIEGVHQVFFYILINSRKVRAVSIKGNSSLDFSSCLWL